MDDFQADDFQPDDFQPDDFQPDDFQPDIEPVPSKGIFRKAGEFLATSPTLPIAGGVAGGLAGMPSGPGAIATAAMGGAGGEAYRQLLARSMGLDSPQTSAEAAKKIGIAGVEQGASEALGSYALAPGLKVAGKAIKMIPGVKPAINLAEKTGGQLFQLATKIKPEYAKTLFKNPKAILPGQMEKASKIWRAAATEAGIPVDDVSPEIIEALKSGAKNTVYDTFQRLKAGEAVTAAEAQTAKQAIDIGLMPAAKTERNRPLIAQYEKIRKAFVDRIGQESPALAKANKGYAIAKAGEKFKSIFPQNLDQSPAYFRSSILPLSLFGMGVSKDDPIGGLARAGVAATATSPITYGLGIAGAGALRSLSPVYRRALLSSYLSGKLQENR